MFFSRRAGHRIVDKGDVASYDYVVTDFTKDDEWNVLDLSDKIPVGTKLVHFSGIVRSDVAFGSCMFREYGNTLAGNTELIITQAANECMGVSFEVVPNKDRKIDYLFNVTGIVWFECSLTVCRYVI
ncbi:unnamed protein product [marine sediment metagenome]|uniref:Uncharacterized protein n=1 Tax=marine sediment metagenome TaxID=412755 RepID=X1Q419_9ZZZZ